MEQQRKQHYNECNSSVAAYNHTTLFAFTTSHLP